MIGNMFTGDSPFTKSLPLEVVDGGAAGDCGVAGGDGVVECLGFWGSGVLEEWWLGDGESGGDEGEGVCDWEDETEERPSGLQPRPA